MKAVFSVSVVLALAGAASASVVDSSPVGLRPAQGPFQMTSGGLRGGTLVYDSSTQTGFRFNPGAAGGTTPADNARVAFDDVPIPDATLMGATSLDVCRLTVGIRRLASAPATDVSVYWSTLTTIVTAPDTNLDLPATLLGTVSLAANGTTTVTELVTFGSSGGPTLFNVPLNLTLFSGFGAFTVGVNLSNTDSLNGWRLTSGPSANADVFWLYDPNHSGQPNDELATFFGGNPAATFYIVVEGNPVPAPGGAAILGLLGLIASRRRRSD